MKDEEIIVTKDGFKKLNEELRNLIDVVLPEIIEKLKEARYQIIGFTESDPENYKISNKWMQNQF